MTLGSVRDAHAIDIDTILEHGLRDADCMELNAIGITPRQALLDGFEFSETCKTILTDGVPSGMFGVCRSPSKNTGFIWLLGSELMMAIPRGQFLRESRRWLKELSVGFDGVGNLVHQDNTVHIKWLRWLGFTFLGKHHPFIHFARITPCATSH